MIPEIRTGEGIPTLYVNGEPFFARSGEIHNSGASDPEYMDEHVWPALRELNMNALIVPLYWEKIEPEEGIYDFTLADSLISQARREGMHLIFLWFGLWKNGESMYVPGWMKTDTETYFRAKKVSGEPVDTISPLCEAAVKKDAAAFAAVMEHIREVDEAESTVIFVQVENEIGLLGTDRDYGEKANEMFAGQIPECLQQVYQKCGTWQEVFGEDAAESFMAYQFAAAVETITRAGRERYPLPCYANSWLKQYPWYAGSYPSGGPAVSVHAIWKAAAPSLFTLAPDIYVPYVPEIMEQYGYEGNPLVIPEVRKDAVTSSYALYAFAGKNAVCYSPFGIEELALSPDEIERPPMELMAALNIDPSAFETAGSSGYLSRTYEMIDQMMPLYLKYRGTGKIFCFVRRSETDYGTFFRSRDYDIAVAYAPREKEKPVASGVIFELEPGHFLIGGMMCSLEFRVKSGENKKVNLIRLEEGEVINGEWKPGRTLNGDEKSVLKFGAMPGWLSVELFKY